MESTCDDGKGKKGRSGGDLKSGAVSEYLRSLQDPKSSTSTCTRLIITNKVEDKQ
jgi:hypothetical protein